MKKAKKSVNKPKEKKPKATKPVVPTGDVVKPLSRGEIRKMIGPAQLCRAAVRYMVDQYYQIQDFRKASGNQLSAIARGGEESQPITEKIHEQIDVLEKQVVVYLDEVSDGSIVGRWAKSIVGIGPVISAGLLAHIDITRAPTVGHIWRFAGLDPTQDWLGKIRADKITGDLMEEKVELPAACIKLAIMIGCRHETLLKFATTNSDGETVKMTEATLARAAAKRPWNSNLKTLCWKIGESFVKVSGNPNDVYGKLYLLRKEYEQGRNMRGELADQAAAKLKKYKIGKSTEAYGYYSKGLLPPAHIHSRAMRWVAKLFLAHWHQIAYEVEYGCLPPKPYVMEHLGHVGVIGPPNWPMEDEVTTSIEGTKTTK